jgi:hypothetical protein
MGVQNVSNVVRGICVVVMAALLVCALSASATTQQSNEHPMLAPEQQAAISELVGHFAEEFSKKNCPRSQCRILVADFTLSSGESCQSCRALSDAVEKELIERWHNVDVVGRDHLRAFLEDKRIPSANLADSAPLEWLGGQFRATHVLSGSVELKNTEIQLIARFQRLEISPKKGNISQDLQVSLPIGSLAAGLAPSEAFSPQLIPPPKWEGHEVIVYDKSDTRMVSPRCTYMPTPSNTPEASKAKVGGTIHLEAVVTLLSSVDRARIVSGLPYGLNEQVLKTVKTWRCRPGTVDGAPVPMLIPVEVTFRSY